MMEFIEYFYLSKPDSRSVKLPNEVPSGLFIKFFINSALCLESEEVKVYYF